MTNYGTYATLTDLKDALQITGVSVDTRLRAVLESASRAIDEATHRHFYIMSETRYFDGQAAFGAMTDQYTEQVTNYGYKLWVPDLLAITTLQMDSDADATYEDTLTATDYMLWPWNKWPKVRIDLDLRQGDYRYWVAGPQSIKIFGSWGYGDGTATPYIASGVTGTVATAAGTTLTVSSATGLAVGHTWLIESEQVYCTAISGTSATIVRGVNGTTAAAHDAKAIYIYQYPGPIRDYCLILAERIWKRKDAPFGVMGSAEFGMITIPRNDPDVMLIYPFMMAPYRGAV